MILTNATLFVASDKLSVPNVVVNTPLVIAVPSIGGNVPTVQPLDPLPPAPAPGIPAPSCEMLASSHPLIVEVLSICVPGAAI